MHLGQLERDLGRLQAAGDSYREAVKEARAAGEPIRIAHALRHLADVEREQGQVDSAVCSATEAVELIRKIPDVPLPSLANTLRVWALVLELKSNFSGAKAAWQDACCAYERAEIEAGVAECKARLNALDSKH